MNEENLIALVTGLAPGKVVVQGSCRPLTFVIPGAELIRITSFLHSHPDVYADRLSCITGLDNGPEQATMEVIWHFDCLTTGIAFAIKVVVDRQAPEVPSLATVWKSADWLEREVYDMYGILFTGHRDLRRILMPADWEGFPLRKDYVVQDVYHGVKVESTANP
jgi:NADH-quinone oxidoreductase subunit C